MIGVNAGSGQRPFGVGWINLDIQFREHSGRWPDVVGDMFHLPFPEGSMDLVVFHHVLEHSGNGEADGAIREAQRVLKVGGSMLVFVPDLRILAQRWLTRQLPTELYLFQLYGAYMGSEHDRHKWGGDMEYWYAYVGKFGWAKVKVFDWRVVEGADFARDYYIIGLECVK